ncbi:MAG: hypothetical protein EXS16_08150 [Gemmataceae bacterium]|nr:hypothetical protein [Gemmataceae bacterium]
MFRRVEARFAGPTAIGVLVPQGERTLVVVRPRALRWDLLPARWDGDAAAHPHFCTFSRDEAAAVARRFIADLNSASLSGEDPVQTFGNAEIGELQIWVRTNDLVWIVCERTPGRPYEPAIFATLAAALNTAQELGPFVHPRMGDVQDYYFNTQSFA